MKKSKNYKQERMIFGTNEEGERYGLLRAGFGFSAIVAMAGVIAMLVSFWLGLIVALAGVYGTYKFGKKL